jgi:wobble nucleotide-excising tRNase
MNVEVYEKKIEQLENDLSNTKTKLDLSNRYIENLESKLNVQNSTIQIPFILIVFIVLIISLFILKLTEKNF